jgi:hypothetical protein
MGLILMTPIRKSSWMPQHPLKLLRPALGQFVQNINAAKKAFETCATTIRGYGAPADDPDYDAKAARDTAMARDDNGDSQAVFAAAYRQDNEIGR